jgi:predicted nucleic acid-binding protein
MIVVSNTSPLNYLVLVQGIDLLPMLYGQVHVPPVVLQELSHPGSPALVRVWAQTPPAWLVIRAPTHVAAIAALHAGETHAIALARELNAEAILMDESAGRKEANACAIQPIGTLGVLYEAAGRRLVDLPSAVARLMSQTNFHANRKLIDSLLRRYHARNKAGG